MKKLDLFEVLPAYLALRRRVGILLAEIVIVASVEKAMYDLHGLSLRGAGCGRAGKMRTLAILRGSTNLLGSVSGASSRLMAWVCTGSGCTVSWVSFVVCRDEATSFES